MRKSEELSNGPMLESVTAEESPTVLSWRNIDLIKRHPTIPKRSSTVLTVIDVQTKLLPTIVNADEIVARMELLIRGAHVLGVPVICTEQYPRGLGATDPRILRLLGEGARIEKSTFSAAGERAFGEAMEKHRVTSVVIVGIETHVCVAQTALDLKAFGINVIVAADAVSSRTKTDRSIALNRLQAAGVVISSVEGVLFDLTEVAGTPEFKEILRLVR